MKIFKLSLLTILILTLTFSAFSQRRFGGKVVEVLDGKTAVVQMPNGGKLTVTLQYIEIPEPDQPLYQVVKEHLQNLILNQGIEVNPRGITDNKTLGQIYLKGVDISRQMLRDGAVWYAVPQSGGQVAFERVDYQEQEAQAKAEKRGVWGIEGMKPAWEFRAAKEEARQAAERAEFERIKSENQAKIEAETNAKAKLREQQQSAMRNQQLNFDPSRLGNFDSTAMWENAARAGITDDNGLIINRFRQYNAEIIFTAPNFLTLSNGKQTHELECQFGYLTYNYQSSGEKEFYGFACKIDSDKETFKKSHQLTITADGKKTVVSKAIQSGTQTDKRFNELLIYDIDRDFVMKLSQAGKVTIKIGEFSGTMTENIRAMTKSMVLEIAKK